MDRERHGMLADPAPTDERGDDELPSAEGESQPNVTPEEQGAYDRFVDNGLSLIYDKKSFPMILRGLAGTKDPVDSLANTAAMVVMRLNDSARKAGTKIDDAILLHGTAELVEDLAGTAEKAKIHTFTQDELNAANTRTLDMLRQMMSRTGALDQNAMMADFKAMAQAEQQGGGAAPGGQPAPAAPAPPAGGGGLLNA